VVFKNGQTDEDLTLKYLSKEDSADLSWTAVILSILSTLREYM